MRPLPAPPAEHALHDELLVARFAATDELPDDERILAVRLVADCAACASLAADLDIIARAVASEPLPPRRRDFRITAEQAERLRGSRIQRLLRRLTLPEAAILRPAAAAVMSLGLLLVVAGSVVPGPSPGGVRPEPLSRAPAAADTLASQQPDLDLEDARTRSSTKAPEADGITSDTSGQEDTTQTGDTAAMEAAGEAAPLEAAADDMASASPMQLQAPGAAAPTDSATTGLMIEREAGETLAVVEEAPPSPGTDAVVAAVSSSGMDLGVLLVVIGAVLTLGGLLVLLVALLARRLGTDPLVR